MNRKTTFIKSPVLRQQAETIANLINPKNVKPMTHIVLLSDSESQEKSAIFNFKENLRDDTWDNNNCY